MRGRSDAVLTGRCGGLSLWSNNLHGDFGRWRSSLALKAPAKLRGARWRWSLAPEGQCAAPSDAHGLCHLGLRQEKQEKAPSPRAGAQQPSAALVRLRAERLRLRRR